MPIYEYRCESCGHELDALQKIKDSPLVDCPECGRPALKKLISAASFRLKGGGWYETDFKKGNKKNLHDTGPSRDGDSGGDKKKETKEKTPSEKKAGSEPGSKPSVPARG